MDKDGDASIIMHNNSSGFHYRKWNRRLMNLLWIFAAILFVVEIVVSMLYGRAKPVSLLPAYILRYVLVPVFAVCFLNAACELAVRRLEYVRQWLQPYVIISALVMLGAILSAAHYVVTAIFAIYALPVFFSLVYHDKRILRFAFLSSLLMLIATYTVPRIIVNPSAFASDIGGFAANLAILCASGLIAEALQARLDEIVRKLTDAERAVREAETARKQAEAASAARTRFLANTCRALRAPVNGIAGLSGRALDDEPPERQKDSLQKIKNQADRLLATLGDIGDIAEISAGEAVLQKIPFDLHSVLNACEAATAPEAAKKGLRLYCYNETKLSHKLVGDPARLRQVLLLFLSNAVRFTEHGSVTLVAKPDGEFAESGAIKIIFEISDTGIGIASERLDTIFEPFCQTESHDACGFGGSGLGLCTAKQIIEAMGGVIEVRSIANIGSRFSFSLELILSREKSAPEDYAAFSAPHPVFDGEVLLCEDDEINRQVTVQSLERLGLRVVLAENGKDGVEAACQRERDGQPFGLILMDIYMPVMDGLQAATELAKRNVKTPVIAMTANTSAEDREKYASAGMSGYLCKPFKAHELYDCLSAHLTPVRMPADPAETHPMPVRHTDNAAIDAVVGVENFAGSKPTYMQALDTFAKRYAQTPEMLEKLVADQDFALAQRTAHTEKGAAAIIGAHKLSELLAVLEEACRRDGLYFKSGLMETYKDEHARVLLCIAELLS